MKILLAPLEVSGYCMNLRKGFKELNIDIDFINMSYHPFNYGGNDNCKLSNLIYLCNKNIYTKSKNIFFKIMFSFIKSILKIFFFIKALFKYDVYIFVFGQSLLPRNLDLIIYKLLNKTSIMNVAMGSEARPPYFNGTYYEKGEVPLDILFKLKDSTHKIYKKICFIERFSKYIIGAPFSTSPFSKIKFINYFALGFPQAKIDLEKAYVESNEDVCRILHCPSHPFAKGTEKIKETINNLKSKGYNIEFKLIQNITNHEVLLEIQKSDFVIDQIYSDTPLAGFAAEAMAFGKVPIVGGYSFDYLNNFIPDDMLPPSLTCHPTEIEAYTEKLIKDINLRKELGEKGREFLTNQWSAKNVAERYMSIIKNEIPKNWFIDPYQVNYFYGMGQDQNKTKSLVKQFVENFGVSYLFLDHNPVYKEKLLKFADEIEGNK